MYVMEDVPAGSSLESLEVQVLDALGKRHAAASSSMTFLQQVR